MEYLRIILHGALLGMFLSFFIGATFFVLIETSINKGFRSALAMNLGVFLSDTMIILLASFTATELLGKLVENNWFRLCGGIAFIGFGSYYILKRKMGKYLQPLGELSTSQLFFKGILINLLNPSVIAFWLGASVLAISQYNYSGVCLLIYFATTLGMILTFDILKIYSASKLERVMNQKILNKIHLVAGLMLVILGIKLIIDLTFN